VSFARTTLFLLTLTATASAQTFEQIASLRIHEQPMSARSAAMGAAGDALSADGSDLVSNPAFLASLRQPVFSLSAAQTSFDVLRIDVEEEDFVLRRVARNGRSLSHVAAAVPLRGAVFGVYYRDEPAVRAGFSPAAAGSAPFATTCLDPPCQYVAMVLPNGFERRDRRYGVSAAFERGALSFGAGAELRDLDESYNLNRYAIPASIGFEQVARRTAGRRIVPTAGIRWRISPRFAVAGAYHGGATFDRTDDVCVTDLQTAECVTQYERIGERTVRVPSAMRASVAVAPVERVVLTAEAVRRKYGDLDAERGEVVGLLFPLEYRDVTELHAGAEVRLPRVPVALRAGWWRQPAHADIPDYLGMRGDLDHVTFGARVDVGAARVDVAYDNADAPATRRAIVAVTIQRP